MSNIQSICSVINGKYTEQELKLTLSLLGKKKQSSFIELVYYLLEDDTPLFIELFGGQVVKIPTKYEFFKSDKQVKIFLFIINHINDFNVFNLTSYKTNLSIEKIYETFINCYELFVYLKPKEQIEIDLNQEQLSRLEQLYFSAKQEIERIKLFKSENENKQNDLEQTNLDDNVEDVKTEENVNDETVNNEQDYNIKSQPEEDIELEDFSDFELTSTFDTVESLSTTQDNELSDEYKEFNKKQLSLFSLL